MNGTPFGRYRLIAMLGRGGMGEVWRAYDTVTERVVALKVLPAHSADNDAFQQRFRREARAAAALNDPHVVPIHDVGEIDGRLFLTMRLVEGDDLQTVIARSPLAPRRAVTIIEGVASALEAAHRIDLVHRDVKPSNILVAKDDFAYLIDFGIANAAGDTRLTSTGTAIGTWAYMAPERFRTGLTDASADVYALTCVLHECLTGRPPFPGESLEQLLASHMFDPPPRTSWMRNGIPAAFDTVIATGMAKTPDRRYRSAQELAAAARAALNTPQRRVVSPPAPAVAQPPVKPVVLASPAPVSAQPVAPLQTPEHPPWWRRRRALIPAGILAVALVTIVVVTTALLTVDDSEQVAEEVRASVVNLTTSVGSHIEKGSGIVLYEDGHIVTNAHLVDFSSPNPTTAKTSITFADGQTKPAVVKGVDWTTDIAVVQVTDATALSPIEMGFSTDLRVGEEVIAVTASPRQDHAVASGVISSINRPVATASGTADQFSVLDALETNIKLPAMGSGGALLDTKAKLIGMTTTSVTLTGGNSASGVAGFAIPINQVRRIANDLIANGEAAHASLGVVITNNAEADGAQIASVTVGGPAHAAGVPDGAIVTKLDDREIGNADTLVAAVNSQVPGEEVWLTYTDPAGATKRTPVRLGKAPN